MIELTIPRLPKSPNSLRAHHWTVKHRDKKDWDMEVTIARNRIGSSRHPTRERKSVTVRLFSAKCPLDPDNLHGSIKPILDALKANGLIYDDAEEWLEYTVSQHKVATVKEARTEISICAAVLKDIPFSSVPL